MKQYEFHMAGVKKPMLSASVCESGIESHLNEQLFLKKDEDCDPLITKDGVHNVKTQIVHGTTIKMSEVNGPDDAAMSVASGELKKNSSFKLAEM